MIGTDLQETSAHLPSMGDRIKAVRTNWAWSQTEMAQILGVDQASVSFWERDKIKPAGSALLALASLFRVSVAALEAGQGFRIGDPPFPLEAKKADRKGPRSVSLPGNGNQPLTVVDLGNGSFKAGDLPEAMISLTLGLNAGRRVWLVLE